MPQTCKLMGVVYYSIRYCRQVFRTLLLIYFFFYKLDQASKDFFREILATAGWIRIEPSSSSPLPSPPPVGRPFLPPSLAFTVALGMRQSLPTPLSPPPPFSLTFLWMESQLGSWPSSQLFPYLSPRPHLMHGWKHRHLHHRWHHGLGGHPLLQDPEGERGGGSSRHKDFPSCVWRATLLEQGNFLQIYHQRST